jgi:hypothetical protein
MADPEYTHSQQLFRELQRLRCAVWRGNDREWLHVNRDVFVSALTRIELIAKQLQAAGEPLPLDERWLHAVAGRDPEADSEQALTAPA